MNPAIRLHSGQDRSTGLGQFLCLAVGQQCVNPGVALMTFENVLGRRLQREFDTLEGPHQLDRGSRVEFWAVEDLA